MDGVMVRRLRSQLPVARVTDADDVDPRLVAQAGTSFPFYLLTLSPSHLTSLETQYAFSLFIYYAESLFSFFILFYTGIFH